MQGNRTRICDGSRTGSEDPVRPGQSVCSLLVLSAHSGGTTSHLYVFEEHVEVEMTSPSQPTEPQVGPVCAHLSVEDDVRCNQADFDELQGC